MTTSVGARSFYETECDPGHLQEAIRSGLALRTYNLTIVVGSLFVVSVVSVRRCGAFPAAAGIHVAGGVLTWRICADDYRRIVVSC